MVRINFFALFTVLLFVPQILWATVHRVSYNVATVIDLKDDDEIDLVDFPVGWGYSRIVLGINSVPALQLSGHLVANDCFHELHSYYEEFDFAYTGNEKIVYHGSEQKLPIQWWVDANPVVSSCKSYSEILKNDSIYAKLFSLADSIFSERTKSYKDLGELESETYFEGTSSNFKITHLPDFFYNRIYVQVEPMDGRELKGAVFSSGKRIEVSGYSSTFVLERKTALPPTFELAFPEYRKVKLKWWVEIGVPTKKEIETKQKRLTPDSVEVEYVFDDNLFSKKSVKIIFDKRKFSDGKIPVIRKFSFDPHGSIRHRNFGVHGDVYEIEANVNSDDSITIAIPIGNGYRPGKDSVVMEYFNEEENRWEEQPVDSVDGDFAYVQKPQRLWWLIPVIVGGAVVGCALWDDCRDAVGTGLEYVGRGVKWVVEVALAWSCLDFDKLGTLFGFSSSTSGRSNWDIDQGSVEYASLLKYGDTLVDDLRNKWKTEDLKKISDPYPGCGLKPEDLEICKWQRTRDNLDILLADGIVFVKLKSTQYGSVLLPDSRFSFSYEDGKGILKDWYAPGQPSYDYDDYFMVSSGLLEDAAQFVNGAKNCLSAVNLTGGIVQQYIDVFDGLTEANWTKACNHLIGVDGLAMVPVKWVYDAAYCGGFLSSSWSKFVAEGGHSILDSHEGKLIAVSEAMVRISLLAWLKKADEFRKFTLLRYKTAYDGIRAWLELAGPFLDFNNLAIKGYGSLALYEYIHFGTDENLKMVNGALNRHYGDNGGYSEGTGYSQYIWDDIPYVLAALKDAYKSKDELDKFNVNEKFLKSPDYMFEFSRPVGGVGGDGKYKHYGLIPVEVDDGVSYNPDYRVWAKLKDDPKYLAMSEKYPLKEEDGKINPLVPFGFPEESIYNSNGKVPPNRDSLWGDFKDGIGMITAVNGDDTVALSMIAENGKMWTRGQAHDQQDNLSITLASSKKGFLIQDPGYSGFGARSEIDGFHRYTDHNVLTTSYTSTRSWGQNDNKLIPFDELWTRVYDFTGDFPGLGLTLIAGGYELFSNLDYKYAIEGGEPATFLDTKINEPQSGVIGFTATTKINPPSTMNPYDNNRTIMYFGGNFWVIDRPTNTDDVSWIWLANSPMSKWDNMEKAGVRLYGSRDGKLTPEGQISPIVQNGTRNDFIALDENIIESPKIKLKNYRYMADDAHTKTYVMTYSLGDETFAMDRSYCPITAYQCFVNTAKNMRVVVPPSGTPFKLCDVLPKNECSGDAYSTDITMFAKTPLGEWTTRWVLDGDLWANENGFGFKIASATVSRTSYIYEKLDGTPVHGKHAGTYLPALPILLLR